MQCKIFFFGEFCHDYSPNLLAYLHFAEKIIKLLFTSLGGHIEKNCAFYLENCLRSHDLGNSFYYTDLLAGQWHTSTV